MKIFFWWFLNISVFLAQAEIQVVNKRIAENISEKNSIQYRIIFENGNSTVVNKEFNYDIPTPKMEIINNEKLLLINSFYASLETLDTKGQVLQNIILSNKNAEYERSLFSAINNGKILAALNETSEYSHQFFMLDSNLNILSKSEIKSGLLSGIAFDNTSKSIFASVVFTNENEIRKVINVFDFDFKYKSSFAGSFNFSSQSQDHSKILLYDNSQYCLYDMPNNQLLFQKEETENKILSAKFVDESIALLNYKYAELVNSNWIYLNPEVYLLSIDRKIKTKIETNAKKFSKHKWNNNKLSLDNNTINLK